VGNLSRPSSGLGDAADWASGAAARRRREEERRAAAAAAAEAAGALGVATALASGALDALRSVAAEARAFADEVLAVFDGGDDPLGDFEDADPLWRLGEHLRWRAEAARARADAQSRAFWGRESPALPAAVVDLAEWLLRANADFRRGMRLPPDEEFAGGGAPEAEWWVPALSALASVWVWPAAPAAPVPPPPPPQPPSAFEQLGAALRHAYEAAERVVEAASRRLA